MTISANKKSPFIGLLQKPASNKSVFCAEHVMEGFATPAAIAYRHCIKEACIRRAKTPLNFRLGFHTTRTKVAVKSFEKLCKIRSVLLKFTFVFVLDIDRGILE